MLQVVKQGRDVEAGVNWEPLGARMGEASRDVDLRVEWEEEEETDW